MIKLIDNFLNNITMYRLVLYYLVFLIAATIVLSFLKNLPFDPVSLIFTTTFILAVSYLTNLIFAKVFTVPTNIESVYISALILSLIISPLQTFSDLSILIWAPILAMSSKYIFAIGKKHLFNPAALAVMLTAVFLNESASWWVGNIAMLPFVLMGGILIVRKTRRFSLIFSFFITLILVVSGLTLFNGGNAFMTLQKTITVSPILFFAFVMLTEPLTIPPTKILQITYGAFVGFLFAPQIHIGSFYTTPESALVIGNIFSYLVSPKKKLILSLKNRIQLAPDIFNFTFSSGQKLSFSPGQYLEWTLAHSNPDNRGIRRYFTIASSPTEQELMIGVKFYEKSSSFKKALLLMQQNDEIVASNLRGEFTLPKDPNKKFVFIAGGIGITPFRSMIKYLLDTDQTRSIVLLYSNKFISDIVYKDVFDLAQKQFGLKIIYTLTEVNNIPPNWNSYRGFINKDIIEKEIPDYKERYFYLSGPNSMVSAFQVTLKKMGITNDHIKTDFFPGFA